MGERGVGTITPLHLPIELLPLSIRQVLIVGDHDEPVPPKFGRQHEKVSPASGDDVAFIELKDTCHFEVIVPGTMVWGTVEDIVRTLLVQQQLHCRESFLLNLKRTILINCV